MNACLGYVNITLRYDNKAKFFMLLLVFHTILNSYIFCMCLYVKYILKYSNRRFVLIAFMCEAARGQGWQKLKF